MPALTTTFGSDGRTPLELPMMMVTHFFFSPRAIIWTSSRVRKHFLKAWVNDGCPELSGALLTAHANEKRHSASAAL